MGSVVRGVGIWVLCGCGAWVSIRGDGIIGALIGFGCLLMIMGNSLDRDWLVKQLRELKDLVNEIKNEDTLSL